MKSARANEKSESKLNDFVLARPHELLNRHLIAKQSKQKSFSLRALAGAIEVSPAYLSQVFTGKKNPSVAILAKIRKPLAISKTDFSLLEKSVAYYGTQSPDTKRLIKKFLKKDIALQSEVDHQFHSIDELSPLTSAAHFAFLALTTCEGIQSDERWIAKKLGVSISEVSEIIRALLHAGLIKKQEGQWAATEKKISFPSDKTHPVLRRHQSTMLKKTIEILNKETTETDVERRRLQSAVVAINPAKIEAFKARMNEFLFEAVGELSEGECTEVYLLGLQFVPLTKQGV